MHICLVSREYPPFFGGGIGTYTVQFSQALAAAGHRVVVVTVGGGGTEEREQQGQVTVVRLPFIQGDDWSAPHPSIDTPATRAAFEAFAAVSVFAMQVARALPGLHAEFSFDVVELPDTGALGWFALNARQTGEMWASDGPALVSCIHSPSDWIAHYNRTPIRHAQDHELVAMERDSMGWSDGLVCPSHAVAQWVEEYCLLRPGTVDVIPHCLGELEPVARRNAQSEEARPGQAIAPSPSDGRRSILFASRLEPRKGVDTLLAGFARAVERRADLHLDLVGQDTPSPTGRGQFGRTAFASLVQANEGLRDRVRFHGKLAPAEVAKMQSTAHAVAIPAPMDNFPYACMEAMAHGRPIIAARAGGMEQMVGTGGAGMLFEPGDAESCAVALLGLAAMNDEQRQEMGRQAAARILEVCGNQVMVERRIVHYQGGIDRRKNSIAAKQSTRPRSVVLVNAATARPEDVSRLAAAIEMCDFAIGWLRLPAGDVFACSTPRNGPPGRRIRETGPIALAGDSATHEAIAAMLRPGATEDARICEDAAGLLGALCSAGFRGAVVPEVITAVHAPPTLHPDRRLHIRAIRKAGRVLRGLLQPVRAPGASAAAEYHAGTKSGGDGRPPSPVPPARRTNA